MWTEEKEREREKEDTKGATGASKSKFERSRRAKTPPRQNGGPEAEAGRLDKSSGTTPEHNPGLISWAEFDQVRPEFGHFHFRRAAKTSESARTWGKSSDAIREPFNMHQLHPYNNELG